MGGLGLAGAGAGAMILGFFSGPGNGATAMTLGAGCVAAGFGYMAMSK